MNKPVYGLVLGGVLGIFDGLSALVSAPETAPQIGGIVIGSTIKGVMAGALIGFFASRVRSVPLGILFGAAPAWFATRTDPIDALRGAGRTIGDRASFARKALLVVQATLSVVLVAGSTMLARSLGNLENQDFGFEVDGRVLVALNRPPATYSAERLSALYRDVEARLNRLPGVQGTGLALYNPLTDNWGEGVLVAGKPLPPPGTATGSSWDRVSGSLAPVCTQGSWRSSSASCPA